MSEALLALLERAETRRYRKGTLLIQEGDFGDTIYIILTVACAPTAPATTTARSPTASTALASTSAR